MIIMPNERNGYAIREALLLKDRIFSLDMIRSVPDLFDEYVDAMLWYGVLIGNATPLNDSAMKFLFELSVRDNLGDNKASDSGRYIMTTRYCHHDFDKDDADGVISNNPNVKYATLEDAKEFIHRANRLRKGFAPVEFGSVKEMFTKE